MKIAEKMPRPFIAKLLIITTLLTTAILMLVLSGCIVNNNPGRKEVKDQTFDPPEYRVYTVKSIKTRRDITGLGNLEVLDKATVVARIDGILEKVYVKKGDHVKMGDPLFYISNYNLEIEDAKTEKTLIEAEEELETANIQYNEEKKNLYKKFIQLEKKKMEIADMEKEIAFLAESVKKKELLFEKGGLTQEAYSGLAFSLDAKRRKLEIMKKEYELAVYGFTDEDITAAGYAIPHTEKEKRAILVYINTEIQRKRIKFAELSVKKALLDRDRTTWLLKQRVVTSPNTGVVTDIGKFTGEKVNADEALTTVINLKSLVARASFSERDIPFFKVGSSVSIEVESGKKMIDGKIYTVDPYVDSETRSVKVDCIINNFRHRSPTPFPGMFVKVNVPTNSVQKKILIPKEALITGTDNEGYVYIVSKDSRVYRRQVLYTDYDDKSFSAINGLNEGDVILMDPDDTLRDGVKIKIKI